MKFFETHKLISKRLLKEHGLPYVGFTLSKATKALRESRDIALLYF
jgi:hypothetical protein